MFKVFYSLLVYCFDKDFVKQSLGFVLILVAGWYIISIGFIVMYYSLD